MKKHTKLIKAFDVTTSKKKFNSYFVENHEIEITFPPVYPILFSCSQSYLIYDKGSGKAIEVVPPCL